MCGAVYCLCCFCGILETCCGLAYWFKEPREDPEENLTEDQRKRLEFIIKMRENKTD